MFFDQEIQPRKAPWLKGLFKRLLNVKGMVVEDVPVDDSPLRPAPVPVVRVRRRKGALRCSRCGRKCPKYDDGAANGDGATRTSAAMGSSSWAWRRAWRARSMGWWSPKCRGRSRAAGSPGDFEMERAWLTAVASRKTVGGFLRIAWRTAGDIARRVAARLGSSMPCMFDGLTAIGVDETSYRKGRTYITVVVDHKRKRVVWAHDGYGKEVLDLFFRQLTDEQRASITAVTGDGAKWIDASVKEHLPNAERVLDSFHIVSWMTDTLDQVRKRLWNQARRGNDKTATETMKGLKYAVPQEPRRPDRTAIRSLETLGDTDPKGQLYRSWQLKELLRTLPRQPVGQAEAELKRWIFRASHSRIPEIVELCRKIRRRRDDILGTIGPGYSNARLEAFNNKIKVTIRMAYGFRHVDNLIAMIKLRCSGLPTHLPTPTL